MPPTPVAMAISIEELDALVRAFYEGRGEQVGLTPIPISTWPSSLAIADRGVIPIAKGCPGRSEPGELALRHSHPAGPYSLTFGSPPQFKEDPDAWLMVDDILSKANYPQTKCMYRAATKFAPAISNTG